MANLESNAPQDAELGIEAPDAAQRSLSDALRVSFALLRLLLIAMVAIFLLSGMFKVKTGEVAVRLSLGKQVKQDGQEAVYVSGGPYFAWPEPIDTVIRVSVAPQTFSVSRAFWFNVKPEDQAKTLDELTETRELDPEQDGFLLTADRNIMHGRWSVTWKVNEREAANFIRTVSSSSTPREMAAEAEQLLRRVAEQALVATVAEHTADEFYQGSIGWDAAKARMQSVLDQMKSGILIDSISLTEFTAPLAVRKAFKTVNEVQSTLAQARTSAETARATVLSKAGGNAHPVLIAAIEYYERLLRRGEKERAAQVEKALGRFFEGTTANECFKTLVDGEPDPAVRKQLDPLLLPLHVEGEAKDTVEKARSAATETIQSVKKETEKFTSLLKQYRDNPRVVRDSQWQETMKVLFAGDAERFYLPPGSKEIQLELNRDPSIKKIKEQKAYEEKEKKAREGGK